MYVFAWICYTTMYNALHPICSSLQTHSSKYAVQVQAAKVTAAKHRRPAALQRLLKSLEQDITTAISQQIAKLPLASPTADHQHRLDWQHKQVPRVWALWQAGYEELYGSLNKYKSRAGAGRTASSRDLLAEDLGWSTALPLWSKSDAQVVSAKHAFSSLPYPQWMDGKYTITSKDLMCARLVPTGSDTR